MSERTEHWWVRVSYEDGTISTPTVTEVLFDGAAPQQAHLSGAYVPMTSGDMGDLILIERVLPPGRATPAALHCALAASSRHETGYVSRLQGCEETDEAGEPTGRAFTLVDGYFDLQRAAEILAAGGDAA